MAVAPNHILAGGAKLEVSNDLGDNAILDVRVQGGTNLYPGFVTADDTITVEVVSVTGTTAYDAYFGVAVVENHSDNNGNYTPADAAQNISWASFGEVATISRGDTVSLQLGNDLGTYRLVLTVGDSNANSENKFDVDTGSTSSQYHADSDTNLQSGGAVARSIDQYQDGVMQTYGTVDEATPSSVSQGYTMTPHTTVSLTSSAGGTQTTNAGDKYSGDTDYEHAISKKYIDAGDGSLSEWQRSDSDASGATTNDTYNVDTAFPAAATGHHVDVEINTADPTPAEEEAGLYRDTSATLHGIPSDGEGWCAFDPSGGHFTGHEIRRTLTAPLEPTVGEDLFIKDMSGGTVERVSSNATRFEGGVRVTDPTAFFNYTGTYDYTGDFSAVIRFTMDNVSNFDDIFGSFDWTSGSTNAEAWGIHAGNSGHVEYSHSGNIITSSTSGVLSAGTEHSMTIQRDHTNTNIVIKVDGTEVINYDYSGDSNPASSGTPLVGSWDSTNAPAPGLELYEVRLWGSLISQTTLDDIADPNGSYKNTAEGTEDGFWEFGGQANDRIAQAIRNPQSNSGLSAGHDVDIDTQTINASADVSSGTTLYNREEEVNIDWTFKDVHGSSIAPASTVLVIHNENEGNEHTTASQSTSPYNATYTITTTDAASHDQTGSPKHIEVQYGHYGSNDPTIDYNTASDYPGGVFPFFASRWWGISEGTTSPDGTVFTGKSSSPSSDVITSRNRGQEVFFNGHIFNARGELLGGETVNFNCRPIGSETMDEADQTHTLSSGQFSGSGASITHSTDATVSDMALVVASTTTSSTNQPRTGLNGDGNYAETDTTSGV